MHLRSLSPSGGADLPLLNCKSSQRGLASKDRPLNLIILKLVYVIKSIHM